MQENDLVMINDIHLMLIPNGLLAKNANAKVGIYFHMPFPSSDVIKTFPYHQELLKSVLLCDVIGFHVFQFARNFLTACKRIFGLFYEIKLRGFITLNYLGRYIIIRIMHAGIDVDYIKSMSLKKEFTNKLDIYRNIVKDKFCLISISYTKNNSGLLLILESYKKLLEKYPEIRKNIILLLVLRYEEDGSCNIKVEEQYEEYYNEIVKEYGESVLHIEKVNNLSVPERFALFSLEGVLFYLNIREGNCMVLFYNLLVCQ
jgi:trehalose 6-phosphate synthase/phosphatase